MEFKKYLIVIPCLAISCSSFATELLVPKHPQKGNYKCYTGTLTNPEVKDITQVRIRLSKETKNASAIIFFKHKSKYISDVFCNENYLGRCGIEDDRGSFEILSLTKQKMIIQFNGKPGIASINGSETSPTVGTEVFPMVDAKAKLKSPIRMTLTIRPKSDCNR